MENTIDNKHITLLYIEDEADTKDLVVSILHRRFPLITLLTAENGQAGLDLYHMHRPDIVLTDIRMPYLDGIRMANKIKRVYKNALIIALTAVNNTDVMLKAMDIGISHYVTKPVILEKLAAVVERCIEEVDKRRQARHLKWLRKLYPPHGLFRFIPVGQIPRRSLR